MSLVRKQIIIPAEVDQNLNQIAQEVGASAAEIVCKALTLYIVAAEKRREGMRLGFVKQAGHLDTEIIEL